MRGGHGEIGLIVVGLVGLADDVDAGHAGDTARNDVICAGHS